MKKIIMLTILAIYVILICVGCKSGKLFIDSDNLEENKQTIKHKLDNLDTIDNQINVKAEAAVKSVILISLSTGTYMASCFT